MIRTMAFPLLPPPPSWYPGHMSKFTRMLPALLSRTDVVLELRDARLPLTSINRHLEGAQTIAIASSLPPPLLRSHSAMWRVARGFELFCDRSPRCCSNSTDHPRRLRPTRCDFIGVEQQRCAAVFILYYVSNPLMGGLAILCCCLIRYAVLCLL